MAILTTTIGAYPKPSFVPIPDWFRAEAGPDTSQPTQGYLEAIAEMGEEADELFALGVKEVVEDQVRAGIDVPTDGEVRRENYIHYHCRHLNGFDFENLRAKEVRGGTYSADLPTIAGPVSAREPFLPRDWRLAQSFTGKPIKITLPGPMTIADTTVNLHYDDPRKLGADLADALNREILALAEAGCTWIQVDEPVLARKPEAALDHGIENLNRCFHGVPEGVKRVMHMCCGYPDALDREDYPKADPGCYRTLAAAVDGAALDAVSIEDAHRPNDLALLELFPSVSVILGVVAIAKSRVEPVEEIRARLEQALGHIDKARLIAAPDCGLGLLGRERAIEKLTNLSQAAKSL
ncbi:MAG: cobalamin-independent methionine synthase II family protein [Pseudomonadota bacterium]